MICDCPWYSFYLFLLCLLWGCYSVAALLQSLSFFEESPCSNLDFGRFQVAFGGGPWGWRLAKRKTPVAEVFFCSCFFGVTCHSILAGCSLFKFLKVDGLVVCTILYSSFISILLHVWQTVSSKGGLGSKWMLPWAGHARHLWWGLVAGRLDVPLGCSVVNGLFFS